MTDARPETADRNIGIDRDVDAARLLSPGCYAVFAAVKEVHDRDSAASSQLKQSRSSIHTSGDAMTRTCGLVLSLFPGAGLLDFGFTKAGFCVVRGPDILLGSDIRMLTLDEGRFDGIIAGPPCQDFSRARRRPPSGHGMKDAAGTLPANHRSKAGMVAVRECAGSPNARNTWLRHAKVQHVRE